MTQERVVIAGAGRMGRGIALSYAFAGVEVILLDLKERSAVDFDALCQSALNEIRADLAFLCSTGQLIPEKTAAVLARIQIGARESAAEFLANATLIYEGVPEVLEHKKACFSLLNECASSSAIIASTTSTFLVTELAELVEHPERFLNAHWLNPAHVMPLVEISRSEQTDENVVAQLRENLESVGKVPVVCNASPGYIVPRIQVLAMNEAARMVEEGVASAEDIDKAVRVGFGLRFAVLGLLEFIDWGGGDILHYASDYLSQRLDSRFAAPPVIARNMENNRRGLRDGQGFFDYQGEDLEAYRQQRLGEFAAILKGRDLLPTEGQAGNG